MRAFRVADCLPPMPSSRSSTRSRIAFAAVLCLLFGFAFGGAYVFRQRQLDETVVSVDSGPPTDTTTPPVTTTPLVVDSTIPVETTTPVDTTLPPESTDAPVTTRPPRELSLSTDGTAFEAASARALWDDAVGCDSIATQTGAASDCDRLSIGGVNIAWVLDAGGGATVLQNDPGVDEPGTWNVELETRSTPTRRPLITDVTGDGQPELLFGFRSDSSLTVDIVEIREGNAGVVLHLDLPAGRVSAGDGQIDVWQKNDAGSFEHWTVTRNSGRWTKDGFEQTSSAPTGNL